MAEFIFEQKLHNVYTVFFVPSTPINMEEVGFRTDTTVSHQGAIEAL